MILTVAFKTAELFISTLFNNGLNKTTESLYNNISEIIYYNPELLDIIEKNDIDSKIKLFKTFLSEYNNLYKIKSIYIAINDVYQMILIINTILDKIKNILKEHTKKILYKYRKPDYGDKLKKLDLYCNLLDKRFNMLLKINNILINNPNELNIDDKLINFSNPNYIKEPELSYILVTNQTSDNNY